MQPLTGEVVTLENVFPRNLETKTTSSVNSLTSFDHFPTCFEHVGLSFGFGLGIFIMFVAFLLLVIVNKT